MTRVNWRRLPYLVALVVATVAFIYPLVWLVSASLKPQGEVFDNKLVPDHFAWHNYVVNHRPHGWMGSSTCYTSDQFRATWLDEDHQMQGQ